MSSDGRSPLLPCNTGSGGADRPEPLVCLFCVRPPAMPLDSPLCSLCNYTPQLSSEGLFRYRVQKAPDRSHLGWIRAESRLPKLLKNLKNGEKPKGALESADMRPRQVRYQAALCPDRVNSPYLSRSDPIASYCPPSPCTCRTLAVASSTRAGSVALSRATYIVCDGNARLLPLATTISKIESSISC